MRREAEAKAQMTVDQPSWPVRADFLTSQQRLQAAPPSRGGRYELERRGHLPLLHPRRLPARRYNATRRRLHSRPGPLDHRPSHYKCCAGSHLAPARPANADQYQTKVTGGDNRDQVSLRELRRVLSIKSATAGGKSLKKVLEHTTRWKTLYRRPKLDS